MPPDLPERDDATAERAFYRAELAGHALVIAVDPGTGTAGTESLASTVAELATAGARVVVVRVAASSDAVAVPVEELSSLGLLTDVWTALRDAGVATVALEAVDAVDPDGLGVARAAAALAARLGTQKLVLTHHLDPPELDTPGFVDDAELDRRPVFSTPPWSDLVAAARTALHGGVPSVNLCHLEDLEDELFTYEGAGILVTSASYLEIGPLRVDEFEAVDRLLRQGQAEGYLRARSDGELARFLFTGFGARIATSGHLAGVGGLETERYAAERAGEIVGLYAISRFVGEGVGRQVVAALLDHGASLGLDGVFAVTTTPQVVAFFERCGFVPVPIDAVPPAKWAGYDAERRDRVVAVWHDLGGRR